MQINQSINQSINRNCQLPLSTGKIQFPARSHYVGSPALFTKHKCLLAAARGQPEQSHQNSTRHVNRPSPRHSSAPRHLLISSTSPSVLSEVLTQTQLKHNPVLKRSTSKTSNLKFSLPCQLITPPLLASGCSADHNQMATFIGRRPEVSAYKFNGSHNFRS
jgi:hypothetical protein